MVAALSSLEELGQDMIGGRRFSFGQPTLTEDAPAEAPLGRHIWRRAN